MNMQFVEQLDKSIQNVAEKAVRAEFEIQEYTVELARRFQEECDLTPDAALTNANLFMDRVVAMLMEAYAKEHGVNASLPARANLVQLCRSAEPKLFPMVVRAIHEQQAKANGY